MKTTIAILLACSMCLTGRAQEQFTEPFELLSTKGHDSDMTMTECAVLIGVSAAGLAFYIWLHSTCHRLFGTNNPPSTNIHGVLRSENLTSWKLVGSMAWDDKTQSWDYRETNSASEPFHFYRLTNYFGQ